MKTSFFSLALLLFSTISRLEGPIVDQVTGKSFPNYVEFTANDVDYVLQSTGVATRTKFFSNLYSIAHYMENAATIPYSSDIWKQIFQDTLAKQLTLVWISTANSKSVNEAYKETFKTTLSQTQLRKLRAEINQFLAIAAKSVSPNDRHVFRWIPGGTLEIEINGEKAGTIQSIEFLNALWGIWLGPNSIINRYLLISFLK